MFWVKVLGGRGLGGLRCHSPPPRPPLNTAFEYFQPCGTGEGGCNVNVCCICLPNCPKSSAGHVRFSYVQSEVKYCGCRGQTFWGRWSKYLGQGPNHLWLCFWCFIPGVVDLPLPPKEGGESGTTLSPPLNTMGVDPPPSLDFGISLLKGEYFPLRCCDRWRGVDPPPPSLPTPPWEVRIGILSLFVCGRWPSKSSGQAASGCAQSSCSWWPAPQPSPVGWATCSRSTDGVPSCCPYTLSTPSRSFSIIINVFLI